MMRREEIIEIVLNAKQTTSQAKPRVENSTGFTKTNKYSNYLSHKCDIHLKRMIEIKNKSYFPDPVMVNVLEQLTALLLTQNIKFSERKWLKH